MDIRQMVDFHLQSGAEATVAARPVPRGEASAFGVIATDADGRITNFLEKPTDPPAMPGNPEMSHVSMGNYIFNRSTLLKALAEAQQQKQDDFGKDVLPNLVAQGRRVFAYDFHENVVPGVKPYEEQGYWRDVGTIEAYYKAHQDMLGTAPLFDLNNSQWPILSGGRVGFSAYIASAHVENSLVGEGAVIHGGTVRNSIVSGGVQIEEGATVDGAIILEGVRIGRGATIGRAIIDKHNVIEPGLRLGLDPAQDRFCSHIDRSGIPIVPRKGMKTHGAEE
jgi:glucose-1-phosphate adenylyltransferase